MTGDVCPYCHLAPCGTPEKCYTHHQRIVDRLREMEGEDDA